MYKNILCEITGGIATITLNRPDNLNSLNMQMVNELYDAINKIRSNAIIRCVVLTGAGRGFCAGADLNSDIIESPTEVTKMLRERVNPIIKALMEMEKPSIAAVNGAAAGAGCGLALACDLAIAKESAYFYLAFVTIGMVPDAGSSYFLPRLVGPKKAMEMALLGEKISAIDAWRMGMINRAVPDLEFNSEVVKLASRLSSGPLAQNLIKNMFSKSLDNTLDKCLEMEAVFQGSAAVSEDAREGIGAFVQKRGAVFKGR